MKVGLKPFSILLLAMVAAVPAHAAEPVSSCNTLAAWAAGLETLPADYSSFTALPEAHRRAVYQRLSAAERSALWQRQWREALELPGWNAEQRALIAEAGQKLTASSSSSAQRSEAMRDLESRVAQAFPRPDALRVFYRLGPRASSIEASAVKVCDCTVGGTTNFCEESECQDVACLQRIDGCGFSWEFPCDGRCV